MVSTAETGHEKNVDDFGTLIEQTKSMGALYNPSNPAIALAVLEAKRAEARVLWNIKHINQTKKSGTRSAPKNTKTNELETHRWIKLYR